MPVNPYYAGQTLLCRSTLIMPVNPYYAGQTLLYRSNLHPVKRKEDLDQNENG
jgi:hypothetical protein